MTTTQHLVLARVVSRTQWQSSRLDVLRAAHASLHRQAQQQGLHLLQEPEETVEVLPGNTRVRITLRVQATAA